MGQRRVARSQLGGQAGLGCAQRWPLSGQAPSFDQSQSLNSFLAAPSIGKLSSMYLHAWKTGLKTSVTGTVEFDQDF